MSEQLGMGVMIGWLAGNESSVEACKGALGKTISSMRLDPARNGGDGGLLIYFNDGSGIAIEDRGRSCCEARYITTDDNLDAYVGATLLDIEVSEGPTTSGEWDTQHEIAFLRVKTDRGVVVCETHNEHNGYYGGFWPWVTALEDEN